MTQEFHISVTPVGNDEYLVRTERVAPGVPLAEEQVIWPVEDWLAQARQLMNDPLLGLLQGDHGHLLESPHFASLSQSESSQSEPPLSLVELGQQLYSALFHGTLRDSWVTAQGVAQHRNEALRLRLGLKGNRLPRLPWEVLYGNDTPTEKPRLSGLGPAPRPLATGTHVIFSRYQPNARLGADNLPIYEPTQSLRVLMVIAAPTDRERLELEQEVYQLQQELRSQTAIVPEGIAGSLPDIQLTILKQPGREQLTQALEQGHYQVLHYAGHSDLGSAGGSLYLVNNRTGLTEMLSGDDLAGLLVNNGIRLAVFNSCRGSYTAASNADSQFERNLAEALVSRGIPAVLAMAEQIPDNVALTLTWLFYRNLKLGYPIDLSLSRARQGLISAYGSHQLYWALPTLYLHPQFDGYLTVSDRSTSNPADQLILIPQGYSALPILATEEVASPLSRLAALQMPRQAEENLLTRALLPDGNSSSWSARDLRDNSFLDETYEEDVSLVADLLRQLNSPTEAAEVRSVPGEQTSTELAPESGEPAHSPASPSSSLTASSRATVAAPTRKRSHRRIPLLPFVSMLGLITIAGVGVWALSRFEIIPPLSLPNPGAISLTGSPDLDTAEPEQVKAIAINYFNQQNFDQGEAAVTTLLDRGALTEAAEALATVPTTVDTPGLNFLWGRLAWQGISTGNPIYELRAARRYWEMAANAEPDNPQYQEALGFAYYEENRPIQAMQAWVKALSSLDTASPDSQASNAQITTNATDVPAATEEDNLEALNTHAGLALGLWRSSFEQSPAQRDNLIRKAGKIYQMVQQQDPNGFQPDVLQQNWLWSDSAIRDWQALSRIQP
ncbi:MAG: CHAT domain-containing protein [Elainellaceae cyanobacterium]